METTATKYYDPHNYAYQQGMENAAIWETTKKRDTSFGLTGVKVLTNDGAIIKEARLLTYSEATDTSIGCMTTYSTGCPTTGTSAFITNTSFWLGSAGSAGRYNFVWRILSSGGFGDRGYSSKDSIGVRPVIVIEKSDL